MTDPDSPMGWQKLVTDGHVRAARIRRLQPGLIAAAVLLLLLGWWLLEAAKPPKARNDRADVLNKEVERRQLPAVIAFGGLPAPRIGVSRLRELPLASSLPDIQRRILTELDRADRVPADLKLKEVEPSAFWRVPWTPSEMVTTGSGRVRLVGGLVNAGTREDPLAARWLAAFREKDDKWQGVTIQGPEFVELPETDSVPIDQIAVTLGPLLKTKE